MSGNRIGAAKAVATMRKKYGVRHYATIGAIGGSKSGNGGFAYDGRTFLQKLLKRPTKGQSKASTAGRVGGLRSAVVRRAR